MLPPVDVGDERVEPVEASSVSAAVALCAARRYCGTMGGISNVSNARGVNVGRAPALGRG